MKKNKLNEDLLVKKSPIKKIQTAIVSEDLGDIYSTGYNSPYNNSLDASELETDVSLKLSTALDGHIVEIKQGGVSFNLANDKFVVLTKKYLTAITSDLEKLKRIISTQERRLANLNSRIESITNLKTKIDSLEHKISNANNNMFK